MTTVFSPGVYPAMSYADYRAADAASKTGLDKLAVSPAHYRAYLNEEFKETAALLFGRLFHMALLEPERFQEEVAEIPNDLSLRTKEGKEWVGKRTASGIILIKAGDMAALLAMQEAVHSHPAASRLINYPGISEASAFWIDPATGLLCKCRPDRNRDDAVKFDIKSTEDASPRGFARSMAKYRYHVQDAFYTDGWELAHGRGVRSFASHNEAPPTFAFVAVEKSPPYAVAVYILPADDRELGRYLYQRDLAKLAECRASRSWPAYSERVETLSLPKWAKHIEEE